MPENEDQTPEKHEDPEVVAHEAEDLPWCSAFTDA